MASHPRILAYNQGLKSLNLEFFVKILLVNNNQVVQKLIDVTTKKIDCDLTSLTSWNEFKKEEDLKQYDLVVFDQEILDEYTGDYAFLNGVESLLLYSQSSQDDQRLKYFTFTMKKPFLPNDFLSLLLSVKNKLQEIQKEEFANLDEKAKLASVDEDSKEEEDELKSLLKDLDISTEDSQDDLDMLLKELPEEEILEENQNTDSAESVEFENLDSLHDDTQLQELDHVLESDIQESQEVQEDSHMQEAMQEDSDEPAQEIDDDLDEDPSELKEDEHPAMSGALDPAEIEKVQNLLNEVQKSGVKVEEKQQTQLDFLQTLLSSRSAEGIREVLDGMQLTINISFPKKENK